MNRKLLLCLIFIFILVFTVSCKEDVSVIDGFKFEIDRENKSACILSYEGTETEIAIPEALDKYKVTSIGREAFANQYEISKITLPNTVETISASAFEFCIGLKEINFPDSLKEIGNTAFANCRALETINLPKNLSKIGVCVFTGCSSLKEIQVAKDNNFFSSDTSNRALLNKTGTLLIQYAIGNQRTSFEIPENVSEIGTYAFEKTKNLEEVTFPESLKKIASYAFQSSSITSAEFGNNLEMLDKFCFNESSIESVSLGNNIKFIGSSAFSWCFSLKEINLPSSVENFGQSVFYMCTALEKITVEEGCAVLASDENGVLFDKDMKTLICYPVGNTIEEYTIPNTVTTIEESAFTPTLNLKKVIISDSVEEIKSKAFAQCANLKEVIYEGTRPKNIASDAFEE